MRSAIILVAVVVALSPMRAAAEESSAKPASVPRALMYTPLCVATVEQVHFTTVIAIDYSYDAKVARELGRAADHVNELWSLTCELATRQCAGFKLDLRNIERKGDISHFDAVVPSGAQLVSRTGKVLVIEWRPWRTLTLDLAKDEVRYRESGTTTEGVGSGRCRAPTP